MKTTNAASLRDLCLHHFEILRIPITSNDLDAVLERADKQTLSHLKFLDLLLGQQAAARRDRSVERRIREARFAERQTLETFDWKFNPQIDRLQIEELATGDFIRRQSNLILVGQSGVGKSHLVQADLNASLADKTLPIRLRHYQRPELLIIDEWGFDRVERLESPQAAHLLYKVIVARHQRRSTALITNIDFEGWADYMTDGPLAMAFLDRLVEGAIIVKIKGRSYRARKAKTGKASSENPTPS
jgi:DNA replication protein DnaC